MTADYIKGALDVTAYWAAAGALFGVLPQIAAGFTIAWLSVQLLQAATGKPLHEILRCAWRKLFPK